MSKITLTTIKKFIKNNKGYLHISHGSYFDGGQDSVVDSNDKGFKRAQYLMEGGTHTDVENRLGISGAWFVRSSRDYFTKFEKDGWIGYEVLNCCGKFILAIPSLQA